jgi:hypothetical protein
MEKSITLVLADGTIIDNLTLNGNNFISQTDVGEDKLSAVNLSHVTINGVEYRDMLLRNYWKDTDGLHIVISEITPQERYEARINSKIDYIAMMEDIDV